MAKAGGRRGRGSGAGPAGNPRLPVEPERLRRQFPDLSEDDLRAYTEVTSRLLADPGARSRLTRDVLERGRLARSKADGGKDLSDEEGLALRYLQALEKMQRPVAARLPRSREAGDDGE